MEVLIKEFGRAIVTCVVVGSCIGILVAGVFIGTSGLNATGARELAGAAAQIDEDDLKANRNGPELNGISALPEEATINCLSHMQVNEVITTEELFTATLDDGTTLPVSITGIKNAYGQDSLAQGEADISGKEVILYSPGKYRFDIQVIPFRTSRSFDVYCEEKE